MSTLCCKHECAVEVPGVQILAQCPNRRRSESESYQKRGLCIGRTCFHNPIEYNEIMDSA